MTTAAWIYWTAGAALGGIGFYLASWALLSDWLAGRCKQRRCAKCWYDMSATAGLKCPECGREAKSEKGLHRSRRRWGWAFAATVLLIGGGAAWLFSVASTLGWYQVLPLSIHVRVAQWTGPDSIGLSMYSLPAGTKIDPAVAARVIEIMTPVAEGKTPGNRYIAADAISRAALSLVDPNPVGLQLLDLALTAPGGTIDQAARFSAQILGPRRLLTEFLSRARTQPLVATMNARAGHEYWVLSEVVQTLAEDQVPEFAELVMRLGQLGHRIPTCDPVMIKFADKFFLELRRLYEDGPNEARIKIMWFLATNTPDELMNHPGMVWFSREACRLLDSPDKAERDRGSGLVHQFRRPGVLPVLPEIVELMSSTREVTRRYARNTLANVRLEPGEETVFVAALSRGLRGGSDFARVLILDVLSVRALLAKPGVRDSLLEATSKTSDATLGEKMLQLVIASDTLRQFRAGTGMVSADFTDVRGVLLDLLDRGGVQTEAACRWLGRLPNPDQATRQRLQAVVMDPSRPLADRAAARDALLHIRDRANPSIDPLTPLELAAPK